MSIHLQRELDGLKRKCLALSALVEEAVQKAIASIERRDTAMAAEVVGSDNAIDAMEVAVEEECLKILALHQPVAFDLRYIVAVLKLNNDLERIGDLAVNIAEQAEPLCARAPVTEPPPIGEMAGHVERMLAKSLDALVNMDTAEARDVCEADDVVDRLHRETYGHVVAEVGRRPDEAQPLVHLLSVSRYLERIADHATNIAEDVIYVRNGDIVRHNLLGVPLEGGSDDD